MNKLLRAALTALALTLTGATGALAADPEARYSMEELSITDAFAQLPEDMRKRLGGGARTGE